MKFAIAIALFVLGQCLVADAWYVTCSRYNRHISSTKSDRNNLWYHVRRLQGYRNNHSSRINSLKRSVSDLYNQLSKQRSNADSLKRAIDSANGVYNSYSSTANSHESRIKKLETVNKQMFADDIITALAENLL